MEFRVALEAGAELDSEAGLAESCVAVDVDPVTLGAHGTDEGPHKGVELVGAADKGCLVLDRGTASPDEGTDREDLAVPLGHEALDVAEDEKVAAALDSLLGDEDLPRHRTALYARGAGHCVTRHDVELASSARRDEASVDACTEDRRGRREGGHGSVELKGGIQGADRVVFMEDRIAEDSDEGIPDVLLHHPTPRENHRLEGVEDPAHEGVHHLGIGSRREASEVLHV